MNVLIISGLAVTRIEQLSVSITMSVKLHSSRINIVKIQHSDNRSSSEE